jgi:hypothetical protein
LRYPPEWPRLPAQERGIDVALAVDFVMMAAHVEYDVGIHGPRDRAGWVGVSVSSAR